MSYLSTDVLSRALGYSDISKKRVSKVFRDAEILADKERMIRNTDKYLISYALGGEWDRVKSVFDTHTHIHILKVATVAKILKNAGQKRMFDIIYRHYDLFSHLDFIVTNNRNEYYINAAINMEFDDVVLYICRGSHRGYAALRASSLGNESLVDKLINKPLDENVMLNIAEHFASAGFPDMMERFGRKHKLYFIDMLSSDSQEIFYANYPINTIQWFETRGYVIDYNRLSQRSAEENAVETVEYLISIGATDFDNIAGQAAGHQAKDVVEMMINKYNVDPDVINNLLYGFDPEDREWYNSTYGYN
jgi:hypothetical protein